MHAARRRRDAAVWNLARPRLRPRARRSLLRARDREPELSLVDLAVQPPPRGRPPERLRRPARSEDDPGARLDVPHLVQPVTATGPPTTGRADRIARLGRYAGPALALVVYLWLPDTYPTGAGEVGVLGHEGRATGAVATWMAVWWMTEAIPLYATALLPLAMLPLMGAVPVRDAASPYAHELIYLFMGGFILALSMQRWGLDRRISLEALRRVGTRPAAIVAGFMGVTAVLSMWVSNTATAVMMLPIAVGVIELVGGDGRPLDTPDSPSEGTFSTCLLLGIAYAASIGGVGTLIGTPPNLFLASYAQSHLGIEISFVRWMAVGLPLVVVFLPIAWLLLTKALFPLAAAPIEGGREFLEARLRALGPLGRGERVTLCVFALTAAAWMGRPWLVTLEYQGGRPFSGLSDAAFSRCSNFTSSKKNSTTPPLVVFQRPL